MINSDFALGLHSILLLAAEKDTCMTSSALSSLLKVHPVRIRKVLSKMKNAGYIESKEGAGGGFFISCNIERVTLKDIYTLTQDDLMKAKCHSCCSSCKIGVNIDKVLDSILSNADEKFQDYLEEYTLKKVLDQMQQM